MTANWREAHPLRWVGCDLKRAKLRVQRNLVRRRPPDRDSESVSQRGDELVKLLVRERLKRILTDIGLLGEEARHRLDVCSRLFFAYLLDDGRSVLAPVGVKGADERAGERIARAAAALPSLPPRSFRRSVGNWPFLLSRILLLRFVWLSSPGRSPQRRADAPQNGKRRCNGDQSQFGRMML